MLSIYDIFAEYFAATIIVFFVLLLVIAYVVARSRSLSVFRGLFFAIGSFFSSPFIYFKKSVLALADYSSTRKTEIVQTKQYLLSKLIVAMQAFLVIASIALLATGFVSAWNQLVPSKQLRESIGATEEGLNKLKAELAELGPIVKQMEDEWTAKRASLVGAYESDRSRKAEAMIQQNNDLAAQINAGGDTAQQTLSEIRSYHAQNEYLGDAAQYEPVISEIGGYIRRQSLAPEMAKLLTNYNNNWYAQMLSRFETRTLSENQLRFAAYPAFHSRQQRLEFVKEAIPVQERDLGQLRSEVRYNFEGFILQIVLTLLVLILFVWAVGLFIDWIGLGVDVAAYVQKSQGHFAKER